MCGGVEGTAQVISVLTNQDSLPWSLQVTTERKCSRHSYYTYHRIRRFLHRRSLHLFHQYQSPRCDARIGNPTIKSPTFGCPHTRSTQPSLETRVSNVRTGQIRPWNSPNMSDSDLSAPSSPSSAVDDEGFEVHPSNGLRLELAPFGLERVLDYEPGGHHPVHLDDLLGDGSRYRVVHKLGTGGFANIWLCRDLAAQSKTKYVALKILMAELSMGDCRELLVNTVLPTDDRGPSYIAHALDHFRLHGPNGSHLCFVYPVLGPKASLGLYNTPSNPDEILRGICHQAVEAMNYLHSRGICHGGTCPSAREMATLTTYP